MSQDNKPPQSIASIMQTLLAGGTPTAPAAPAIDPMSLMMAMEERRAAAEERREARDAAAARQRTDTMVALAGVLGPIVGPLLVRMFSKPETDPVLLKLLDQVTNRDGAQQMAQAMISMTTKTAEAQIESAQRSAESLMAAKDRMNDKLLERMEERMDSAPAAASGNPWVDGLGHLATLLDKGPKALERLAANKGGSEGMVANPGPASDSRVVAVAGPSAEQGRAKALRLLMRGFKRLNTEPNMPKGQRAQLRAQLVAVLVGVPDLAEAVMDEQMDKVIEIVQPVAVESPDILAWIAGDGVADWLTGYLKTVIAPALIEVMDAEDRGDDGEGEDDGEDDTEDDETEGDDDEEDEGEGEDTDGIAAVAPTAAPIGIARQEPERLGPETLGPADVAAVPSVKAETKAEAKPRAPLNLPRQPKVSAVPVRPAAAV